MQRIQQDFQVTFRYTVHFTHGLFKQTNPLFCDIFKQDGNLSARKIVFFIDRGVAEQFPKLASEIDAYIRQLPQVFTWVASPFIIPGGEACKNDPALVQQLVQAVNDYGIDRHSYLVAIGGGALLDMAGFAAAISHRGVRHVRIPTTVLSQNDSGVGVKNSVNAFNKKNFIGTFAPPFAVVNDFEFLTTLDDRDWRSGIAEAIKVALIKDADFFRFIETNALRLANRDKEAMEYLIYRCAQMHMDHIAGGDPFEMGSSRPLDFGHWSAHKLEQLTQYELRHGEAVAIGIALDCTYSFLSGRLPQPEWEQIMQMLEALGFALYVPALSCTEVNGQLAVVKGLAEFREHLGGQLTIMLLDKIGKGVEVHEIDPALVTKAVIILQNLSLKVKQA